MNEHCKFTLNGTNNCVCDIATHNLWTFGYPYFTDENRAYNTYQFDEYNIIHPLKDTRNLSTHSWSHYEHFKNTYFNKNMLIHVNV